MDLGVPVEALVDHYSKVLGVRGRLYRCAWEDERKALFLTSRVLEVDERRFVEFEVGVVGFCPFDGPSFSCHHIREDAMCFFEVLRESYQYTIVNECFTGLFDADRDLNEVSVIEEIQDRRKRVRMEYRSSRNWGVELFTILGIGWKGGLRDGSGETQTVDRLSEINGMLHNDLTCMRKTRSGYRWSIAIRYGVGFEWTSQEL